MRDTPKLRALHAETAIAVIDAARRADPAQPVRTQGHVLRAADLLSTLAVEATIHHLDLVVDLAAPGPTPSGLREVRGVPDSLLGQPAGGLGRRPLRPRRHLSCGPERGRASRARRPGAGIQLAA